MYKLKIKLGVVLFGLFSLVSTSHAALNDLGNGLVNDTTLNITWLKDANFVKTSCDANNALWQAFNPATLPAAEQSGNTKAQICAQDGKLNGFEAKAWIAVLNAQNYLGHNDWRQPATVQPDASCETQIVGVGAVSYGYNCTGSEMGNLFNVTLSNPNHAGTGATGGTPGTACSPNCFTNTGPFTHIPATSYQSYWSGTDYFSSGTGFFYDFLEGDQSFAPKRINNMYVWPVHSNKPASVPTLSLWGLGFMSLLLAFVARRKAR